MTEHVKYPRTLHLPWSPGATDDDKIMDNLNYFIGKRVIVTEKMDGECTTMYNDHIHARSLDSKHHYTRDWVKNFWSQIKNDIPEGFRICGENLYAKHSIHYKNLPSYFMGFSVWNGDECLSWKQSLYWFKKLNIVPVNVLYNDIFDEYKIRALWKNLNANESEGYVVRVADEFNIADFNKKVAKWVRENHVQTDEHWMHGKEIEKNLLIND